jgi:hypothetical protein
MDVSKKTKTNKSKTLEEMMVWEVCKCLPMIIHRTPSSLLVPCNKWILEDGNLITQLNDDKRLNRSGGGFRNSFFFTSDVGWIKSITSISSSV